MNLKIIFPAIAYLIILTSFWACNKDKVKCADEAAFCTAAEVQDYDAVIPVVNGFLSSLKRDSQDESLQKLTEWLDCKSCVANVEIFCNSCILTNPPQSELEIVFNTQGTTDTLTLDISMEDPLKMVGYH